MMESHQYPTVTARRSVVPVAPSGQKTTLGSLCGFKEIEKFCTAIGNIEKDTKMGKAMC